jgi:hypothetical protein
MKERRSIRASAHARGVRLEQKITAHAYTEGRQQPQNLLSQLGRELCSGPREDYPHAKSQYAAKIFSSDYGNTESPVLHTLPCRFAPKLSASRRKTVLLSDTQTETIYLS